MLSIAARCMLTPMVVAASPLAKRDMATSTSWVEVTPATAELDGDRRDEETTSPECFEVLARERRIAVVVDRAGRELVGIALGVGDHRRSGFRGGVQLRGRGERRSSG